MAKKLIEKIGAIAIYENGSSYLIRFNHQSREYCLGRGKISKENLIASRAIASQINSDILFNRFEGINRYKNPEIKADNKTLRELWAEFVSYQNKFIKASTFRAYMDIQRILEKIDYEDNPKYLESKLLKITTKEMTRRCLGKISQCYRYHDPSHPDIAEFKKLLSKYVPSYSQNNAPPYCLSNDEIEKLRNSDKLSQDEKLLIEIWLNTGCRPSSALAIKIEDIDLKGKTLRFNGSIQRDSKNRLFISKGSKNNKFYSVPINEKLNKAILNYLNNDLKPLPDKENCKPLGANYLFWDYQNNRPLSLQTLRQRGLLRKIREITGNPKIIFYNFRDTFISFNILKNKPIAVIGKWVDSSVREIERKYFDATKIDFIPD